MTFSYSRRYINHIGLLMITLWPLCACEKKKEGEKANNSDLSQAEIINLLEKSSYKNDFVCFSGDGFWEALKIGILEPDTEAPRQFKFTDKGLHLVGDLVDPKSHINLMGDDYCPATIKFKDPPSRHVTKIISIKEGSPPIDQVKLSESGVVMKGRVSRAINVIFEYELRLSFKQRAVAHFLKKSYSSDESVYLTSAGWIHHSDLKRSKEPSLIHE